MTLVSAWPWLCLSLWFPCVCLALRRSGLGDMSLDETLIWIALTVPVFGLLLLSRHLPDGISLSYSGAAFLALTLGFDRALLSMSLLLLITRTWSDWGTTLVIDALLPVWLMLLLARLSRRHLPANPFIFLLGLGFFGLFLVYAVQAGAGALVSAWLTGQPIGETMFSETTGLHLLLAGGEATLEGMVITLLVVYWPKAVRLFDDRFYLSRPM